MDTEHWFFTHHEFVVKAPIAYPTHRSFLMPHIRQQWPGWTRFTAISLHTEVGR